MKTTVLVKLATQSIMKNKMRAALTMLGIIIGVAAVIVMVAVGFGARSRIRAQINNLGTNMIVITPGAAQQGGVSQGAQAFPNLSIEDVEMIRKEAQVVTAVSPVVVTRAQVIGDAGNWRTLINGVDVDYQTIRDWQTSSGDFFSSDDVDAMRKTAVLGKTVADQLFPGSDPVGQEIQIRNVPFDVVGVLAPKGQTASGSDSDDVVLIPHSTARTALSGRTFIPQILASTASEGDIPAAQEEIRVLMRESRRLGAGDAEDFTVRNQNDLAQAAEGSTKVMTMLLAAIASISLLVGGIGIMNIMLASVMERTREIGVRRAIGAKRRDVIRQFLIETTIISLAGGIIGVLTGVGLSQLIGYLAGWSTIVTTWSIVLAFVVSVAIGLVFGLYPAARAAGLDPVKALHYE
ncbi:MAG TPA: ABC transporter permease [Thermoanaerobaculia bacterium]|nr:ABC transporter permease [Thermoanaerobaculia bacterium]